MLFYERPKYRAHPMTIAKEMLERVKHVSGLAVASPPKFTRKSTGGEEVGSPIGKQTMQSKAIVKGAVLTDQHLKPIGEENGSGFQALRQQSNGSTKFENVSQVPSSCESPSPARKIRLSDCNRCRQGFFCSE